jgi:hypothetical protein
MQKSSPLAIARLFILFGTGVCFFALTGILFGLWYSKDGATAPPLEQLQNRTVILVEAPRLRSGPAHKEFVLRFVGDSVEHRVSGYAYAAADTLGMMDLRASDTLQVLSRRLEMAKGTLFRDQFGTSEVWDLRKGPKIYLEHSKADQMLRQGASAESGIFLKGWLIGLFAALALLYLAMRDVRKIRF